MSTTERIEFEDVLSRVQAWTPEMRRSLAEQLLRSLEPAVATAGLRGVPVEQVRKEKVASADPATAVPTPLSGSR